MSDFRGASTLGCISGPVPFRGYRLHVEEAVLVMQSRARLMNKASRLGGGEQLCPGHAVLEPGDEVDEALVVVGRHLCGCLPALNVGFSTQPVLHVSGAAMD